MQFLALIVALATAIVWIGRAASGARAIADVADRMKNRGAANSHKNSFPPSLEAAATLMICTAQLSNYSLTHEGLVSEAVQSKILELLKNNMQISAQNANHLLQRGRALVKDNSQPETSLAPMTDILAKHISAQEARELSDMLRAIAQTGSTINPAQASFMLRYEKRMGLNA